NIKAKSYFDSTVETANDPSIPIRQSIMHPINFEYDAFFDRLSKVVDEFTNIQYAYFPVLSTQSPGALKLQKITTAYTFPDQTGSSIADFQYDVLGQETSRKLRGTQAGKQFSTRRVLTYDALGRITGKNDDTGKHDYTYAGLTDRISNINNGSNFSTKLEWDNVIPRLTSISDFNANNLLHKHEYKYNKIGDITKWILTNEKGNNPLNKISSIDFSYDGLGQLKAETIANAKIKSSTGIQYKYDEFGNRTEVATTISDLLNSKKETISFQYYGPNKLGAISSSAVGIWNGNNIYNEYGETIRDFVTKEYEWDAAGRIILIRHVNEDPGHGGRSNLSVIKYDSFNRIIRITEHKIDPSAPSKSIVINDKVFVSCFDEICVELTNAREPIQYFNKRYHTKEGFVDNFQVGLNQSTYYYSRDHLGSIREIYDASGDTTGVNYDYDRWGVRTRQIPLPGRPEFENIPFGFCGYFYHERSGLCFTKYRVYDPKTGRWLSKDPIGEDGGINLYGYVGNNPVNRIDPLGLMIDLPQHKKYFWDYFDPTDLYILAAIA
ncbi:MAG: RHS repeat-associated core domain-containing protein, partial [Ferruginibacter sp.]